MTVIIPEDRWAVVIEGVGDNPPHDLNWSRDAGTHQIGWFDRNKPTLGKKEASVTPPAFRDALLGLAQGSRK